MEYHHNEPIDRTVPIYQVCHSVVMWSDDDGESWEMTELKPTDRFEKEWPYRGYRWDNNGGECTLTELSDGRLKLICRNALDYFWEYYSSDGGETWTDGEPSRFHGTLLVPDSDENHREALQINRISDSRLRNELQGVAWNFPAMKQEIVEFDMRVSGSGLRVSLADHWFNVCDEYVGYFAQFSTELDARSLDCDKWISVKVVFDTEAETATIYADDRKLFSLRMQGNKVPDGLSYLHLQTLAQQADEKGSYIRNFYAKKQ